MRKEAPESEVQKSAIRLLLAMGCYVWRNNSGRRGRVAFGKEGSSDILGCTSYGRMICVECKTLSGKLSDPQKAFKSDIEQRGGLFIVARTVDDILAHEKEIRHGAS
jgi:hypothetical protein